MHLWFMSIRISQYSICYYYSYILFIYSKLGLTGMKSLPDPVDPCSYEHKEEITTKYLLPGPFPPKCGKKQDC